MIIWVIVCPRLKANGMALFPFILVRKQSDKLDQTLINHEKIHLVQQLELLILPFYILYLFNYLINLVIFKKHDLAYRKIIFEKEAYAHDRNLQYLGERRIFASFNYLSKD